MQEGMESMVVHRHVVSSFKIDKNLRGDECKKMKLPLTEGLHCVTRTKMEGRKGHA